MWFGFAGEYLSHDFSGDHCPSFCGQQLRRSCFKTLEQRMHTGEHRDGALLGHMHAGDEHVALARVLGLSAHRGEHEWTGADRLKPLARVGRAHVQAPPVVDQRVVPCHQRRAFELFAGEPGPTPLILQFIETVLAISPIPVQLGDAQEAEAFAPKACHQHHVFVELLNNGVMNNGVRHDKYRKQRKAGQVLQNSICILDNLCSDAES